MELDLFGTPIPPHAPPEEPRHIPTPFERLYARDCDLLHKRLGRVEFQTPPATGPEIAFRHSGWAPTRSRIHTALQALNTSPNRLSRFEHCGSSCTVEYSKQLDAVKVCSNHCHDRFCQPCQTARANRIQAALAHALKGKEVRFITLTLKHQPMPLTDQIDRLNTCFRNLRATVTWASHVTGGISFIEIKKDKSGRLWHPHIHAVVEGDYFPHSALSAAWKKVTGDSEIVDVRAVGSLETAVGYIAKYATKAIDHSVTHNPDALQEAISALHGRRMYGTFGAWRGIDLDPDRPDASDWTFLARMNDLWPAYLRGEEWAIALMGRIRGHTFEESDAARPLDKRNHGADPPRNTS